MSENAVKESLHTTRLRGADLVAKTLERLGVDYVFSVSGNHIMPLYDALFDTGITIVHARHEAACVHMADAYARLTGKPGIALVTGGQAHANAAAALFTALANEAPVVLLSGHAALDELGKGAFQEMRQAELAAPVSKQSWRAGCAEYLDRDIAEALRIASSNCPGPVHLSLPVDLLEQHIPSHCFSRAIPDAAEPYPAAMSLSLHDGDEILRQLASAKRPIVLYGPHLCAPRYREHVLELERRLAVPVVGMESPRGIRDPSLGAFHELLCQADLIVLLGKALDFTLNFGAAPVLAPNCKIISIQPDCPSPAQHSGTHRAYAAEAVGALRLLTERAKVPAPHSRWLEEVNDALHYRPPEWATDLHASQAALGMSAIAVCDAVRRFFIAHPSAILVSDGGEFGQWAQAFVRPAKRLINGPSGTIGPGIPFAIAAKLAEPNAPVIAMMGDGTFGFHMAEIDTAIRYGLPIVVIIGNDAKWNAEHQIQLRDYGASRLHACELRSSRYDKVVEALGGYGELVTRRDDLDAAIERAISAGKPACLNVLIESLPAPVIRRQ
ncbi:MAG TPA: thiamine pyrophosphate-binding protein [Noviherbaspirillum sp.]